MSNVEITPAMEAVAGAVGGCLALSITYPLQSVSMMMQMHAKGKKRSFVPAASSPTSQIQQTPSQSSLGPSSSDSDDQVPPPTLTITPKQARVNTPMTPKAPNSPHLAKKGSTVQLVTSILKEKNGVKRLYSGLGSSLYGQLVIQAVYYYFYSLARKVATRVTGAESGGIHSAICASIAGSIGAVVTNPIWVVSTRQIKTGSKKTLAEELRELYKEEGLAGWYKGLGPALLLVSNPTIQYGVFEKLSIILRAAKAAKSAGLTSLEIFFLSAIAKVCSTLCTYPYIMAKTTLQSQTSSDDPDTQYTDAFSCMKGVLAKEGVQGLYAGINSKIWQSVLTASLMFVLHSKILSLVRRLLA